MRNELLPLMACITKDYWVGVCVHFKNETGKSVQHLLQISHTKGNYYIELKGTNLSIKNIPDSSKLKPVYELHCIPSEMEHIFMTIEDKTGQAIPVEWWIRLTEYKKAMQNIVYKSLYPYKRNINDNGNVSNT